MTSLPSRLALTLLLALPLSWGACGRSEPSLRSVPPRAERDRRAIEAATRDLADPAVPRLEPRVPPSPREAPGYIKPANVLVDVRWLGGRSLTLDRPEIERQLGPLISQESLEAGRGEALRYENGTLYVVRDRVYRVHVPLPRPVTRGEALELTGFPPFVDNWRETDHEYRLGHEWGFVRFRFKRASPDNDKVVSVEAWKQNPKDVTR